jgi:four helix bundle protein
MSPQAEKHHTECEITAPYMLGRRARAVVLGVIDLAQTGWKPWASALFSQLQRSCLSVQLNIAEGYAYGDSPSFRKHLSIAYGSAVETGELLELALEVEVVSQELGTVLLRRNQRSQRLLLGMIRRRNLNTSTRS